MNNHVMWYAARSAGILAWVMLGISMLWGLALSTGVFGRRPRPAWLLDLHRFLGAAAVIFTGVHVLALIADNYVHFTLLQVLVPFTSTWRAHAVAWGIVGFWMLLAVELTSLIRKRLSPALWRRVHYLSFAVFVVATIHGFLSGTDTRTLFAVWVVFAMSITMLPLIGVRLFGKRASADATSRIPAVRSTRVPSRVDRVATSNATAPRSDLGVGVVPSAPRVPSRP
jgi:methionine sulfoxide reductase heme-binding subunit